MEKTGEAISVNVIDETEATEAGNPCLNCLGSGESSDPTFKLPGKCRDCLGSGLAPEPETKSD